MSELDCSLVQHRTYRLIASRFPTVGVFDDLTNDEDDLRAALVLEMATNDRLSAASERLQLLPRGEVVSGDTATIVMAAFLHANERGGRFTDGRLGAWYAGLELETAIQESLFHNDRYLRFSEDGFPNTIQIRQLIANIDTELVDIRGKGEEQPELYDPDPENYGPSQSFGVSLRWPEGDHTRAHEGAPGIIYDSVRGEGGTNVCIYWPSLIQLPVIQGDHLEYRWAANGDVSVVKLESLDL